MKYVLNGGYDKVNSDIVATLLDLGRVSRDLGETEGARFFFKSALEGLYVVHGKDHQSAQIASTLTQIGGLSYCSGLLADAKKYFQMALDMKLHLYGKDAYNDDLASSYNNLGSLHARLKHPEEAFRYYELALEQYNRMHIDGTENEGESEIKSHRARTLHNLGLLSFNLQHYKEAKRFYTEAVKLKSEVFKDVDDSPDLALTLSKLSSVESRQGRPDAAKYYQDQAIKRSRTFLESHRNLLDRSLLPPTPEEAAALMSMFPSEANNGNLALLNSMGLWNEADRSGVSTKTCLSNPFNFRKGLSQSKRKQQKKASANHVQLPVNE